MRSGNYGYVKLSELKKKGINKLYSEEIYGFVDGMNKETLVGRRWLIKGMGIIGISPVDKTNRIYMTHGRVSCSVIDLLLKNKITFNIV